jgi:hypothetical protein
MFLIIDVRDCFSACRLILAFKLELIKLSHNMFVCIGEKERAASPRTLLFLQSFNTFPTVEHRAGASGAFKWLHHDTIAYGAFIKF